MRHIVREIGYTNEKHLTFYVFACVGVHLSAHCVCIRCEIWSLVLDFENNDMCDLRRPHRVLINCFCTYTTSLSGRFLY